MEFLGVTRFIFKQIEQSEGFPKPLSVSRNKQLYKKQELKNWLNTKEEK